MDSHDADRTAPTTTCRVCHAEVPGAHFCGMCGTRLVPRPGDGPDWLRLRSFGAAPREHVLRPSFFGAMFSRLDPRALTSFRAALVVMLAALVVFALLRISGGLIGIVAFGLPVLFVVYLYEVDAHRHIAVSDLIRTAVLGVALGAGWVLLTGAMVARSYSVPLGGGVAAGRLLTAGVGVSAATALLAFAPVVMVRLRRPASAESLDGFVIGALGALSFTAAATLTRLYAQLRSGLVDHDRPATSLLVEAGIRGFAAPVTAAAAGGLIGAALWFTRPQAGTGRPAGSVRRTLVLFGAAVATLYVCLGVADMTTTSQWLHLGYHLAVAFVAVLLLRIGLQLALLHEAHDDIRPGQRSPCRYCGEVVPETAFCPACGLATRAAAAESRATLQPAVKWAAAIAAVAVAMVGLSALMATPPTRYMCPPNCGRPPMGAPVVTNPRFTAADDAFAVSYPAAGSVYTVTRDASGITAHYISGDGGTLRLFSEPARRRSPKEIATALLAKTFPDARTAYEIPNAMVGYQPGYGLAADTWPQGANADYLRMRVLVMVAVKNDLALIAGAVGPYHEFGPDFGGGPPSGANLEIAEDMGKYVNSFSWRGDQPR